MTNTVNKKTNEEEISIIISAEHADYLNEIEECFPWLTIDPCYIRKSRGELPMKIIIFLWWAIMSGLTWDIIKLWIQKVYDKFSKKELDFSIKFENMFFSINKDWRVKAITLDHEQFSHIKTLDDLYVYIQEKTQSKMPNVDWKATTLGEITQMNLESISTNFWYDKILYLDTWSITENKIEQLQTIEIKDAPSRAKRLVKEWDIIYSTVRPNQKHFWFMKNPPKNLVVSTGFTVISPEKDIDGKFIYYYITQNYITEKLHQIAEQAVSAYPSIRPENIKQLPIHLPPLPEQQAIAAVLSSFDDKIELLRAENQTLEQMGQELFKERFGKWKIGDELPEGWRVATDYIAFEKGVEVWSSNYYEKQSADFEFLPFYRVGDIASNGAISNIFCDKGLLKEKIFYTNDVLLSLDGTVGRVFIWWAGWYSSGIRKLVALNSEISQAFLYFWAKSEDVQKTISLYSEWTTIQHAGKSIPYLMISADIEKIKNSSKILNVRFDKILLNLEQIQSLSATRDQLLPKLMSGEVRVEF